MAAQQKNAIGFGATLKYLGRLTSQARIYQCLRNFYQLEKIENRLEGVVILAMCFIVRISKARAAAMGGKLPGSCESAQKEITHRM